MAELLLTDAEKALPFWTDLDDASLGKALKKLSLNWFSGLKTDDCKEGAYQLLLKSALIGVSLHLHDMNADTGDFSVLGVSRAGVDMGDWEISFRRTREPSERPTGIDPDLQSAEIDISNFMLPMEIYNIGIIFSAEALAKIYASDKISADFKELLRSCRHKEEDADFGSVAHLLCSYQFDSQSSLAKALALVGEEQFYLVGLYGNLQRVEAGGLQNSIFEINVDAHIEIM